jgi:hypothetical protein
VLGALIGPAWYRAFAVLSVVLRALPVVLVLQLSGAAHFVEEAVSLVSQSEVHHEQCPPDGPCDDCPPGCPQCHCANALRAALPPVSPSLRAIASCAGEPPSLRQLSPPTPELPSLFKPPRFDA